MCIYFLSLDTKTLCLILFYFSILFLFLLFLFYFYTFFFVLFFFFFSIGIYNSTYLLGIMYSAELLMWLYLLPQFQNETIQEETKAVLVSEKLEPDGALASEKLDHGVDLKTIIENREDARSVCLQLCQIYLTLLRTSLASSGWSMSRAMEVWNTMDPVGYYQHHLQVQKIVPPPL